MGWIVKAWEWVCQTLASKMLFRRMILITSLIWIAVIGERVTRPEILLKIEEPGAKVAISIFALLSVIVTLYQYLRGKDGD
jgi:hypothetical protein